MSEEMHTTHALSPEIAAIKKRGRVVWSEPGSDSPLKAHFGDEPIPVLDIRRPRIWGIQINDERELEGHERSSIPDEERWQIKLQAKDGSTYEVNSALVRPAPGQPGGERTFPRSWNDLRRRLSAGGGEGRVDRATVEESPIAAHPESPLGEPANCGRIYPMLLFQNASRQ